MNLIMSKKISKSDLNVAVIQLFSLIPICVFFFLFSFFAAKVDLNKSFSILKL